MSVLRLYGAWEAADFLGVTKQALFSRRKNDPLFPVPAEELRSGPVWTHDQLEEYKNQKIGTIGRLNPVDVRGVLELNVKQFEFYADQHEAKLTNENLSVKKIRETTDKAIVNREMARMNRDVLEGRTPENAPWLT